jgi:hypothetical protein
LVGGCPWPCQLGRRAWPAYGRLGWASSGRRGAALRTLASAGGRRAPRHAANHRCAQPPHAITPTATGATDWRLRISPPTQPAARSSPRADGRPARDHSLTGGQTPPMNDGRPVSHATTAGRHSTVNRRPTANPTSPRQPTGGRTRTDTTHGRRPPTAQSRGPTPATASRRCPQARRAHRQAQPTDAPRQPPPDGQTPGYGATHGCAAAHAAPTSKPEPTSAPTASRPTTRPSHRRATAALAHRAPQPTAGPKEVGIGAKHKKAMATDITRSVAIAFLCLPMRMRRWP